MADQWSGASTKPFLLSRRDLLRGGTAAACSVGAGVLAGCAKPVAPPPQPRTLPVPLFFGQATDVKALGERLTAGFESVRPDLRLGWVGDVPVRDPGLALVQAGTPAPPGYQIVQLSPELVDLSPLLPSVADVFAANGGLSALPIALTATGMRYTSAVLPFPTAVPKADWRVADLENAAAVLDAEFASGRLPGASTALPLLIGQWTVATSARAGAAGIGSLGQLSAYPERWLAIVAGFGGWVYRRGAFDLTNRGALYAFARMVRWQRLYGPDPMKRFATVADLQAFNMHAALGFGPGGDNPPTFQFAPFPLLPDAAPIPIAVRGLALVLTGARPVPPDLLRAFGDLMGWLYAPAQQALMATYGVAPLGRNDALQGGYWGAQSAWPGLVPGGGWVRFSTGLGGMPAFAPLAIVSSVLNKYTYPSADVGHLSGDLLAAQDQLNAWLARNGPGSDIGGGS